MADAAEAGWGDEDQCRAILEMAPQLYGMEAKIREMCRRGGFSGSVAYLMALRNRAAASRDDRDERLVLELAMTAWIRGMTAAADGERYAPGAGGGKGDTNGVA